MSNHKSRANVLSLAFAVLFLNLCLLDLQELKAGENKALKYCLEQWGKSPFTEASPVRNISAKVRVLGVGPNVEDKTVTDKPALIMIRPSVNVLSKMVYELQNPNGWYCFRADVTVLGTSEINIHCDAKIAFGTKGATVLGKNEKEGGVVVLGKTSIKRTNCAQKT